MTIAKLHPTPAARIAVQAEARANHMAELAEKAAQAAQMAADDVRAAHRWACHEPDSEPLELLLRDAIADAVRLADRLALIATFTR